MEDRIVRWRYYMDQTNNPRGLGLGRGRDDDNPGRDRNPGGPGSVRPNPPRPGGPGSVRPNPPRPGGPGPVRPNPPRPGGPGPIIINPPRPGIPIPIPIPQPVQEIIQVNNAVVEEVDISAQFSTVTIAYQARNNWNVLVWQRVRLIITNDTIILNQFGARIGVWGIRVGMRVNARFSSRFTRSQPPQAQAYFIRIIGFQ